MVDRAHGAVMGGGGSGGLILLRGKSIDGNKHRVVDRSSVKQNIAKDCESVSLWEDRSGIQGKGKLDFCPIA